MCACIAAADCKLTTAFAPFTSDSNDTKLFFFLILISKSVFAFNKFMVSSVQLGTSHHLFAKSDGSNTRIYLPSFFQGSNCICSSYFSIIL